MNFTADIDLFLADFGVPITAGAISGMGIYDKDSEIIISGDVVRLNHSIKVRTDLFGSLSFGDSINVDGNYYIVEHEPMRSSDGLFSVIPLKLNPGPITYYLTTLDDTALFTQAGQILTAQSA